MQDGHGMLGEIVSRDAGQAILAALRQSELRHKRLAGAELA
jgi:hypothetical protein